MDIGGDSAADKGPLPDEPGTSWSVPLALPRRCVSYTPDKPPPLSYLRPSPRPGPTNTKLAWQPPTWRTRSHAQFVHPAALKLVTQLRCSSYPVRTQLVPRSYTQVRRTGLPIEGPGGLGQSQERPRKIPTPPVNTPPSPVNLVLQLQEVRAKTPSAEEREFGSELDAVLVGVRNELGAGSVAVRLRVWLRARYWFSASTV